MAKNPTLLITGGLNKQTTKERIQKQLDKLGGELKLTIGVDKNGAKSANEEFQNTQKTLGLRKQISANKIEEYRLDLKSRAKIAQDDARSLEHNIKLYKTTGQQNEKLQERLYTLRKIQISDDDDYETLKAKNRELQETKKNIQNISSEVKATGRTNLNISEYISGAIKATAGWYVATTAFYQALHAVQNGIATVYDLSNALNDIRIVTNYTTEEVNKLGVEYNKLSKELGVTTQEITKTATEFFRQGLSQDAVNERLQATAKYAKISGLSIQEAGDLITASANGTSESVAKIIDVFSKLGDETASGADEIGKAMSKVAGSAKVAGIPFEQLAASIATVSSKTRESAETIGNSFKSIIARYGSIKETGFNEEDATNLNEVTKALKTIGIQAIDSQGQLRPFGEVLDEVGKKFNNLDRNTQGYIATTLGGTFQANRLITLLTSYPDVLINVEKAYDSTGSAQKKFDIYLESNEAKLNKLKSTLDGLWIDTINSETVGNVISLGTAFLQLADNIDVITLVIGGLSGLLVQTAIPALFSMIAPIVTMTGEVTVASGVWAALNAVISANPFVLAGLAIAGVTVFLSKQKSETERLIEASNEHISLLKEQKTKSDELATSIDELSKKENKTYEESMKLRDAKEQLISIYPELKNLIESETLKQGELAEAIKKTTKARLDDANASLVQQRFDLAVKRGKISSQIQGMQNRAKEFVDAGTVSAFEGEINANKSIYQSLDSEIKAIDAQLKASEDFAKEVISASSPTNDSSNSKISGIKTPSDKKDKDKITLMTQLEKQLEANNHQLSIQKELTSQIAEDDPKKLDSIKQEIALYQQRQNLLHLQANAVRAEQASIMAKGKLTDADKKRLEELQSQLYQYGQEWTSLKGDIINANKAVQDYYDNAKKIADEKFKADLEFTKDQIEEIIDALQDGLKGALEATEQSIKDEAEASEKYYNDKIQSIKDSIDKIEEQNEITQEQINLQEKLMELEKLRQQRLNILSQKNVRFLVGNEFQFIADPLALQENAEAIANAEKDLSDTRQTIADKERKRQADAEIKSLEEQKDKSKQLYDQRLKDFKTYSDGVLNELKSSNGLTVIEQDTLYNTLKQSDQAYFTNKLSYVQEMASKIRAEMNSIGQIDYALGNLDTSYKPKSLISSPVTSSSITSTDSRKSLSSLADTKAPSVSKTTNTSSTSTNINIGNISMPTTVRDGGGFVKELERLSQTRR